MNQPMSLEQIHATRAEQRKQRLIEAEMELAAEEAEALHMTEEQKRILMQPFTTVKAEFADLDGLRWTQTALRKLQPPQRRATTHVAATSHATSKNNTFVVLTNADLANFSTEDTIRVSSSSNQSRPTLPSPLSATKQPLPTPDPAHRHRDGSRSRSPIKGLFPSRPESAENPNPNPNLSETLTPIKAPSNLRFSVPQIGDVQLLASSSHGTGSTEFSRHPLSPPRIQTPAPPGLMPVLTHNSPTSDPSMMSVVCEFPQTLNQDDDLTQYPTRPVRLIKRRKTTDNFLPRSHRDAPSPPMSSSPPLPSVALAPTLSLLCPPSPPLSASRISTANVTTPSQLGIPHKSARARLHSLLHDDTRRSSTSVPTNALSYPPLQPVNTTAIPPPSAHLDISSSLRLSTLDAWPTYSYDDDETPTPSPVSEHGDESLPSSSSAPWIHS